MFSVGMIFWTGGPRGGGNLRADSGSGLDYDFNMVVMSEIDSANTFDFLYGGTVEVRDSQGAVHRFSLIDDENGEETVIETDDESVTIRIIPREYFYVKSYAISVGEIGDSFTPHYEHNNVLETEGALEYIFDDFDAMSPGSEYPDVKVVVVFAPIKYNLMIGTSGYGAGDHGIPANSLTRNTPTISLGDTGVTITNNFAQTTALRFAFLEIEKKTGGEPYRIGLSSDAAYGITYSSNVYTIAAVNEKFLAAFAEGGNVTVTGKYVRRYSVTVAPVVVNDSAVHSLGILLTTFNMIDVFTGVTYSTGQSVQAHPSSIQGLYDEGTIISVKATTNYGYTFVNFTRNGAIVPSTNQLDHTLTSAGLILAVNYNVNQYTLVISKRDNANNDIAAGNAYASVKVNGVDTTRVSGEGLKLNNVIKNIVYDSIIEHEGTKYGYVNTTIRQQHKFTEFENDTEIDEDFINGFVNEGTIEIAVNYSKQFALQVTNLAPLMGNVKIDEIDAEGNVVRENITLDEEEDENYFNSGTKFRITATAADYHSFLGFSGVSSTSILENTPFVAEITINYPREVFAAFAARSYLVVDNISDTESTYSTNSIIRVTYGKVPSNHSIKQWKINGVRHTELPNQGTDVQLVGNTLIVKLSADVLAYASHPDRQWIVNGVFAFESTVETGLNTGVILAFTIPGAVVLVLLVALLAFMYIDTKRKKLIREQLVEKRKDKQKRDFAGYLSDIKEGKVSGQITKADVKAEMKAQKTQNKAEKADNKAKPPPPPEKTAPAPAKPAAVKEPEKAAPAPAPAKTAAPAPKPAPLPGISTQQIVALLDGAAIQGDMTLVKAGKVVGTMQKDGAVFDAGGKAFAWVKLESGNIVDKDGTVVGVVGGNGSISRP